MRNKWTNNQRGQGPDPSLLRCELCGQGYNAHKSLSMQDDSLDCPQLTDMDHLKAYQDAYAIIRPIEGKLASGPTPIWEKLSHASAHIDKQIAAILAPPPEEPTQEAA
jgi:hypothetical protein